MDFKTIWIFETIMYIIYSPENWHGSPENESLEEEIPTNNHHFPVPC